MTGGKGGIGKSLVSSTLALVLASRGARTGLFDLDLTSPCDHLILGIDAQFPSEEFGIDPLPRHGLSFMSVACFSGDAPAPMRGDDLTNALVELLAITRWGDLDVLVIDMPPGLSNATLDVMRLLPGAESLVVATPSRVVIETVRRSVRLLVEQSQPVLGLLENMRREESSDGNRSPASAVGLARDLGIPYLGGLPWDPRVEEAVGDPGRLLGTAFARALAAALAPVLECR